VIEPAKVEIEALKNAASVASMILTTECLVTDAPEKDRLHRQCQLEAWAHGRHDVGCRLGSKKRV